MAVLKRRDKWEPYEDMIRIELKKPGMPDFTQKGAMVPQALKEKFAKFGFNAREINAKFRFVANELANSGSSFSDLIFSCSSLSTDTSSGLSEAAPPATRLRPKRKAPSPSSSSEEDEEDIPEIILPRERRVLWASKQFMQDLEDKEKGPSKSRPSPSRKAPIQPQRKPTPIDGRDTDRDIYSLPGAMIPIWSTISEQEGGTRMVFTWPRCRSSTLDVRIDTGLTSLVISHLVAPPPASQHPNLFSLSWKPKAATVIYAIPAEYKLEPPLNTLDAPDSPFITYWAKCLPASSDTFGAKTVVTA